MRFFLVDDDEFALELLKKNLAQHGHEDVTPYTSPTEALAHLDGEHSAQSTMCRYDCLLLDIQMPGMDGIQLCSEIRKRPWGVSVPIIMVTSLSGRENVAKALTAGATDYLTKPVDGVDLASRISAAASIVREQRRVLDQYLRFVNDQSATGERGAAFALPFKASDADNFLDYGAVENYVTALSHEEIDDLACIAFRPDDKILEREGQADERFLQVVRRVARKFSRNLPGEGSLFTYVGHGIFLALFRKSEFAEIVRAIEFVEHRFQKEKAYPDLTLVKGQVHELADGELSPFDVMANATARLMAGGTDLERAEEPGDTAAQKPKSASPLQRLRALMKKSTEETAESTLSDIRKRFIDRLASEIEDLSADAAAITGGNGTAEAVQKVAAHAHRTAGVAKTLDLSDLGDAAARLDQMASGRTEALEGGEVGQDLKDGIEAYIEECRRALEADRASRKTA